MELHQIKMLLQNKENNQQIEKNTLQNGVKVLALLFTEDQCHLFKYKIITSKKLPYKNVPMFLNRHLLKEVQMTKKYIKNC